MRVRLTRLIPALAAIAVVMTPGTASAWGQNGHRIIGKLADDRIDARTRAHISLILGNDTLAQASTWADEERANPAIFWQREAGPYHYVTIPDGKGYADIGPPAEGDALSALFRFAAVVRDEGSSQEEKALALRFIVHIVGDLHQPLHVGDGTDRGGNDVSVRWFGSETNLHSVWDTKMIENQNLSYTEYAARLDRRMTPSEVIAWWDADPRNWVAESAAMRDSLYPDEGDEQPRLSWDYQYQHLSTLEQRLSQGGVRLAAYLDHLFAS